MYDYIICKKMLILTGILELVLYILYFLLFTIGGSSSDVSLDDMYYKILFIKQMIYNLASGNCNNYIVI